MKSGINPTTDIDIDSLISVNKEPETGRRVIEIAFKDSAVQYIPVTIASSYDSSTGTNHITIPGIWTEAIANKLEAEK